MRCRQGEKSLCVHARVGMHEEEAIKASETDKRRGFFALRKPAFG